MKTILEIAQPYLTAVATALIGLLATLLLALITGLRHKLELWLEARTSAAQREVLHKLAAEAYAYTEKLYDGNSEDKLNAAIQYVVTRMNLSRFGLTSRDVRAAIQKAWAELDAKNRSVAS